MTTQQVRGSSLFLQLYANYGFLSNSMLQVIAESSVGVPSGVAGTLPSTQTLRRMTQRVRNATNNFQPSPPSADVLVVPPEFQVTLKGEPFLVFDSQPGPDRILIFSTQSNIEWLVSNPRWSCDGTFKTCPQLFMQLYTIHIIVNNTSVPLVYALLPDKREATYIRLFEVVKNLNASINPTGLMTDFERSSINAFGHVFPTAEKKGCFFHFAQCLWRKVQQHHLIAQLYQSSAEASVQIRMLLALAFVPPEDVVGRYESVTGSLFFMEHEATLAPLLAYFETTWIGLHLGGRRRAPLFEISLWNCYRLVLQNQHKTNNSIEGWHHKFGSTLGACNPGVWKFLKHLQTMQNASEIQLEQLASGVALSRCRPKYAVLSERLRGCVERYATTPELPYLRGISYTITL